MPGFWAYDNRVQRYAKVRRADCTFCDHGRSLHQRGKQPVAGGWLGPFPTAAQALQEATETGREVQTCGICAPSD